MKADTCLRRPASRRRRSTHLQLKALRINAGLTPELLAFKAGVSRETVRLAEAGFLPSVRVQFALASAVGLEPLDLWPMERQESGR